MLRRAFLGFIGLFGAGAASKRQCFDVTNLASNAQQWELPGQSERQTAVYQPSSLQVNCGSIYIMDGGNLPSAKGTHLLIDGVEQKNVRRIVLTIDVHEAVAVEVEYLVRANRPETA